MDKQVKKTGLQYHNKLKQEAIGLGIPAKGDIKTLEKAIAEAKVNPPVIEESVKLPEKSQDGKISVEQAKAIRAQIMAEEQIRDQIKAERAIITERARIIAESESLHIKIDLPEHPEELDLARARKKLGLEKVAVKPSPETLAIESTQKGYYIFTNREQEDAMHTVNPGGKYTIHLIPDMVHVLSAAHIKLFRKFAIRPVYKRVATGVVGGPETVGQAAEKCVRTGNKPRFSFEHLEDAPDDAEFGLVYDQKILDKVMPKVEEFV